MSIELGDRVKDIVTGYEGIAIGKTEWLTGCDTIGICPTELDKDGKTKNTVWFDVTRIEILEKDAVQLEFDKDTPEEPATKPDNGGPQDTPQTTRGQHA
jgi:hypothetical protein